MSRFTFFIIFWLLVVKSACCQFSSIYNVNRWLKSDSINRLLKSNKEILVTKIKKEHPVFVTEMRQDYEVRVKQINRLITQKSLIRNDSVSRVFERIKKRIIKGSPFLQDYFIILYSNDISPNAYSMGDGLMIINAGLLTKYNSEADLAYVFCHEISHDYLQHHFKRIARNKQIANDNDIQKKMRRAARRRYGKYEGMQDVLNEYLYRTTVYQRQEETEADSLGYILLKNSGYAGEASVNSLRILKTSDEGFFSTGINFKKHFHFIDYPFKESWLVNNENYKTYKNNRADMPDSLSTHPDCSSRIKKLVDEFNIDTGIVYSNTSDINTINEISRLENLNYFYEKENFLLSLYFSLQLKEKNISDEYLTMITCHCLYKIGRALKSHQFSKYVSAPDADNEDGLNELIVFLNNLSYKDYVNLNKHFCERNAYNTNHKFSKCAKIYAEEMEGGEENINMKINQLLIEKP